MSFDDVERTWRSEADRPIPPAEMRTVLADVQRRCDGLERAVHRRDVREILAAFFVVAAFAAFWPIYRSSRVASLGVAVIMLGMVVIVWVLLAARRPAPPLDASVLDFSRRKLAWVDGQIRLLRSVAWWYVAPPFFGCLLFGWGLTEGLWFAFGLFALLDVAVAVWIIALNRRAVRDELEPAREDLARLIESLETAEPG